MHSAHSCEIIFDWISFIQALVLRRQTDVYLIIVKIPYDTQKSYVGLDVGVASDDVGAH